MPRGFFWLLRDTAAHRITKIFYSPMGQLLRAFLGKFVFLTGKFTIFNKIA